MRRRLVLVLPVLLAFLTLPAVSAPRPKAKETNPFLAAWKTPFEVPPFDQIRSEHFSPAFAELMKRQKAEIGAIVRNPKPATFANTVEALDDSGELLGRVSTVFSLLSGAETNETLQAVDTELAPKLASHRDDIAMNGALFRRVKAVHDGIAKLDPTPEQRTLLERTYRRFVRGGANLAPADKERLRKINGELSTLTVKFGDNLLAETNATTLVVDDRKDLAGLPEDQVTAAADAARVAGKDGKWLFTLKAPSIWPFLKNAENRELRRRLLTAYTTRCDHGNQADNKAVFARIASLRAEKARLLGYPTFADFVLEENMAKTPAGAYGLLDQLWKPALAVAKKEAAELQARIDAEKGGFKLEPWDWRFYATKEQKARYDLDEEAMKPYFALDNVREGAFALAGKLYGLRFSERTDLPVYNPEVKTFEVKEASGKHVGILFMDFHPRPGKRGGAWQEASGLSGSARVAS